MKKILFCLIIPFFILLFVSQVFCFEPLDPNSNVVPGQCADLCGCKKEILEKITIDGLSVPVIKRISEPYPEECQTTSLCTFSGTSDFASECSSVLISFKNSVSVVVNNDIFRTKKYTITTDTDSISFTTPKAFGSVKKIISLKPNCIYRAYAYGNYDNINIVIEVDPILGCFNNSMENTNNNNSSDNTTNNTSHPSPPDNNSGNPKNDTIGWILPGETKTINLSISIPPDVKKDVLCGLLFEIYGESNWVVQNISTNVSIIGNLATKKNRNVLFLDSLHKLCLDSFTMKCNNGKCVSYFKSDPQKIKIIGADGEKNKLSFFVNSYEQQIKKVFVNNLDNKEICGYIGSKASFIYTSPQKLCIPPKQNRDVLVILKPNIFMKSGENKNKLYFYSITTSKIEDTLPIYTYVVDLMNISPRSYVIDTYVNSKVVKNLLICNPYNVTKYFKLKNLPDYISVSKTSDFIEPKSCKNINLTFFYSNDNIGDFEDSFTIISGEFVQKIKIYNHIKGPECYIYINSINNNKFKLNVVYHKNYSINLNILCYGLNDTKNIPILFKSNYYNVSGISFDSEYILSLNNGQNNKSFYVSISDPNPGEYSIFIEGDSKIFRNKGYLIINVPSPISITINERVKVDRAIPYSLDSILVKNTRPENFTITDISFISDKNLGGWYQFNIFYDGFFNLVPGYSSSTYNYNILVPKYITPGTYTGSIVLKGYYQNTNKTITLKKKVSINVKEPLIVPNKQVEIYFNENNYAYFFFDVANNPNSFDRVFSDVIKKEYTLKNISIYIDGLNSKIHYSVDGNNFDLPPKSQVRKKVTLFVDSDLDSGWYNGKVVVKDNGRNIFKTFPIILYVPVVWGINNKKGLSFNYDRSIVELYSGQSYLLKYNLTLYNGILNDKKENISGAYISYVVSKPKGALFNVFSLNSNWLSVGKHELIFNLSTDKSILPGTYTFSIGLKLSNGQVIYIPITLKIKYPYSPKIEISKTVVMPEESLYINISLENKVNYPISGKINISNLLIENLTNITTIPFNLSPGEKFNKLINVNVPKHFLAGYYNGYIVVDSNVDYYKRADLFVPVKYIVNFSSIENKQVNTYDLIPEYINFTMYVDNYPNFQILVYSDSPYNFAFKCGNDSYDEKVLKTFYIGQQYNCTMRIRMPDNVLGRFKKIIFIKNSLGTEDKVYFVVNNKNSIDLIPDKYVYSVIPGFDGNLTFKIRNNAPVNLTLIPKIFSFGELGVNESWFELPKLILLPKNTTKYESIIYNPGDLLGIRVGYFRIFSNYGHMRQFDFIIKSLVDVIINV